jgi:hypothetical protein
MGGYDDGHHTAIWSRGISRGHPERQPAGALQTKADMTNPNTVSDGKATKIDNTTRENKGPTPACCKTHLGGHHLLSQCRHQDCSAA